MPEQSAQVVAPSCPEAGGDGTVASRNVEQMGRGETSKRSVFFVCSLSLSLSVGAWACGGSAP